VEKFLIQEIKDIPC